MVCKSRMEGRMILPLVAVLLFCFQLSAADYEFFVMLHSYRNVNSTELSGNQRRPCKSSCTQNCDCDNQFTFCLRSYGGSRSTDASDCPLGGSNITTSIYAMDNIDFDSISNLGTTVNPVPNPILYTGESWPGRFLLYVLIEDIDAAAAEVYVIDTIFVEAQLSTETTPSQVEYAGGNGNAELEMSYWVRCVTGFTGEDCSESSESAGNGTKPISTVIIIAAGAGGGGLLLCLFLLCCCCCCCCMCRRRRNKRKFKSRKDDEDEAGNNQDYTTNPGYDDQSGQEGYYNDDATEPSQGEEDVEDIAETEGEDEGYDGE